MRFEDLLEGENVSAYKIISVVGTSSKSWEDATQQAVSAAATSLRDLRIAQVREMDVTVDKKGKITQYRAKVDLSFKYEV
jgi:flavin-binding protein dodecin